MERFSQSNPGTACLRMRCLPVALLLCTLATAAMGIDPYREDVHRFLEGLSAPLPELRLRAAEGLGMLRARAGEDALVQVLGRDPSADVRRSAALSLAWCGGPAALSPLEAALADDDWSVRQSAWVALTTLTGRDELPFDALAEPGTQQRQRAAWRDVLDGIAHGRLPAEWQADLGALPVRDAAAACPVEVSSTYKGPAGILTRPDGTTFWQTKQVAFPQFCSVDLGRSCLVGCVVVQQYGPGFCMTDYTVEISLDGEVFREVLHGNRVEPRLVLSFTPCEARWVRITSRASENPLYPTTWYGIQMYASEEEAAPPGGHLERRERMVRAAGALEWHHARAAVVATLQPRLQAPPPDPATRLLGLAGLRALGRLGGAEALEVLTGALASDYWARFAADALGETGDPAAAGPLLDAYPRFARDVKRAVPARVPPDDRPGFEAEDRMYETPYAMALALSRLELSSEARDRLRVLSPLLVANLAGDYDGAFLMDREAPHRVTAWLLDQAGCREDVCRIALRALGAEADAPSVLGAVQIEELSRLAQSAPGDAPLAATWLAVLCDHPGHSADLLTLLEHPNHWVRMNAAKALVYHPDCGAAERMLDLVEAAPSEADYGYNGDYFYNPPKEGQDEYQYPAPGWRDVALRAAARLGVGDRVPLLVNLMEDEDNVLAVRHAALLALGTVSDPAAQAALEQAALHHPFHTLQLEAREILAGHGAWPPEQAPVPGTPLRKRPHTGPFPEAASADRIVFIRGENQMPNPFQIDIWRQTYSTTDTGPTYRQGRNLWVLEQGRASPLTHFKDGYVADCEVSWDGQTILFSRRGGAGKPWWHIYEIQPDGSGLRALTDGPYHDVQPAYLPDGRIVFSSSRTGMRDEYHGYPATGLTVMESDGSNIRCIGFNLGRDNEPALLPDGRIVFSRLELFYSRLKTELTVQAVFPDGTRNETLYGPERRDFWRQVTRDSGERWWGEAPPRHRVLRLTQPQPWPDGRILCASTGGPVLLGPGREDEEFLKVPPDWAITSMFPLGDHRLLCAASRKTMDRAKVNLDLFLLDTTTGTWKPLFEDASTADFEPRPLVPRTAPPMLASASLDATRLSGRLLCASALLSRDRLTGERGRLVRVIEGQPIVARRHTHTNTTGPSWKNHTGTEARILGTFPLAADGSLFVEVPADRLVHLQVLDGDRQVVGNQLIWMYARPGETRSCVGCHELPDSDLPYQRGGFSQAAGREPLQAMPVGGEFRYRAKAWKKGTLPDEGEERTRTVRAVNWIARP